MIDYIKRTVVLVFFLVAWASASAQSESNDLYSIHADDIQIDNDNDVIVYKGNAKVVVSNLVIQADTISIFNHNGLPSKITAIGNPIRFHERVPKQNINGTAQRVTFIVPELKLTLIEYSITDPTGNNMRGKKASFVLAP